MHYYSHSDPKLTARFGDALLSSLAPDGGLYMPSVIPKFTPAQQAEMGALPFWACAAKLARHFVDERFSDEDLTEICEDAYDFPVPMVTADGYALDPAMPEPKNDFFLELFHGPTLAFKDFAARFMGRSVSRLMEDGDSRTILVATSGDTGGAIGYSFLNQRGTKVFILYPEGGVSDIQEQQLTTMGANSNVHALRVTGSFDDCQALVKAAFADETMTARHKLMSANSINVGRVVPQSFYYVWASLQAKAAYPMRPLVFSIPSGNLGNLTGGLIAKKMGAPIDRFVVGHNSNDPFIDYLKSGEYTPRPSVPTLSNAMDIGRPNNFPRILELFDGNLDDIRKSVWGASFSDEDTARHMRRYFNTTGYVMCPHTAVGHLAIEAFREDVDIDFTQITVATAHPGKFKTDVERIIRDDIKMPKALSKLMKKSQLITEMEPNLLALKGVLASVDA